MVTISVDLLERSYNIIIGSNLIEKIGDELKRFEFSPKTAIISNHTVFSLFGEKASISIKNAGFEPVSILIPDGEEYKNLDTLKNIYTELLKSKLDRKSSIIALGGGVVGDIAGFAASTYMRGISYIQVPTTLLAQVDSSIGGKTGVDHELGKNMIGTFYQPKVVLIDLDTLRTLPQNQLLAGLAEVIKYGIIYDERLFSFLETQKDPIMNLDNDAMTYIIKRSCEIKAEIVSKDEKESGLRSILNYGHTIGHAIETVTKYKRFLHGEAVAIGMCIEAELSNKLGLLNNNDLYRIISLIKKFGLPTEMPNDLNPSSICIAIKLDKKAIAGELRFILPEKIGKVKIHTGISEDDIRKFLIKT